MLDTAKLAAGAGRWLAIVIVWLIYSLALLWGGWTMKSNAVDAKELKTVTAQIEIVKARAEADREEYFWRLDVAAEVRNNRDAKAAAAEPEFKKIREEIPHVAKPVPETAAPECPVCSCRYGSRFVGVWNHALEVGHGAGVPDVAAGSAAAVEGTGDAAADTVDAADLLTNHTDNAEVNLENRRNYEAAREFIERMQQRQRELH